MNYNERWVLYDSMIQSYRSNFIASQSLMLAVGALFINESLFLELFVAAVALFQTWYIWYRVIRVRAIISDYYKFNTLYDFSNKINSKGNIENNPKIPLTESIYAKNNKIRRRANSN